MIFADQRFYPSRVHGVGAITATRTDRLDAGRAERVAILGTAQRFQIALGNCKILVLQDPEVSSTPNALEVEDENTVEN